VNSPSHLVLHINTHWVSAYEEELWTKQRYEFTASQAMIT
jgi:hypothetical protein